MGPASFFTLIWRHKIGAMIAATLAVSAFVVPTTLLWPSAEIPQGAVPGKAEVQAPTQGVIRYYNNLTGEFTPPDPKGNLGNRWEVWRWADGKFHSGGVFDTFEPAQATAQGLLILYPNDEIQVTGLRCGKLSEPLAWVVPPPPVVAPPETPPVVAKPNPKPVPPPASGEPLEKPLVTNKDLVYLGAFSMPPKGSSGWSNAYTHGAFTHRYVRGELRFLATSHDYSGGLVYEVKYPGLSATLPPIAEVVTDWKDIYGDKRWVDNDGGYSTAKGLWTYGLHWSEEHRRLYWNYGHWYNASSPLNPTLGFSTLDEAASKATAVGVWRFRNRPEKFVRGGCLDVPRWFADRYTGGKTLGVGFGGYFSIFQTGSLGPALCAIDHPDPNAVQHKGYLEQIPLVGYPLANKPPGPPDRCHRNTDYKTEFDAWIPSGNVGYWTWVDEIWSGGTWIDLPDKHGVLFFSVLGHGRVWYERSDRHAERGKYWCLAYHPRDLAAVAQRRKQQWEVQPAATWEVAFGTDFGPDLGPWNGSQGRMVGGATFDARTRRLYVLVCNVWKTRVEPYPRVYCWEVR